MKIDTFVSIMRICSIIHILVYLLLLMEVSVAHSHLHCNVLDFCDHKSRVDNSVYKEIDFENKDKDESYFSQNHCHQVEHSHVDILNRDFDFDILIYSCNVDFHNISSEIKICGEQYNCDLISDNDLWNRFSRPPPSFYL